jgi:hypothetical protein
MACGQYLFRRSRLLYRCHPRRSCFGEPQIGAGDRLHLFNQVCHVTLVGIAPEPGGWQVPEAARQLGLVENREDEPPVRPRLDGLRDLLLHELRFRRCLRPQDDDAFRSIDLMADVIGPGHTRGERRLSKDAQPRLFERLENAPRLDHVLLGITDEDLRHQSPDWFRLVRDRACGEAVDWPDQDSLHALDSSCFPLMLGRNQDGNWKPVGGNKGGNGHAELPPMSQSDADPHHRNRRAS